MKQLLMILVCTSLVFSFPGRVSAGEEPMLTYLKGQKRLIEAEYPSYVRKSFENAIDMHYWVSLENYSRVGQYLNGYLEEVTLELFRKKNEWDQAVRKLGSSLGAFEVDAITLKAYLSRIDRLAVLARTLSEDFEALASSWQSRCNAEEMSYLMKQFDPVNTMSVSDLKLTPKAADYYVGVTVSTNFNGGNTVAYGSSSSERGAIITGVSAAAGATAGSIIPGLGTVAGGLIGSLVGALISGFLDAIEHADAVNQQWDVIKEIYDTQINILKAQSRAMDAYVHQQCPAMLPDTLTSGNSSEKISALFEKLKEDSRVIKGQGEELKARTWNEYRDLVKRYFEELQFLVDSYYPRVEREYWSSVEKNFENQLEIDERARKYVETELGPKYLEIKKSKDMSRWVKTQRLYDFWDVLISGDVQFYPDKGFSFQSDPNTSVDTFVRGFWIDLAEVVRPWFQ